MRDVHALPSSAAALTRAAYVYTLIISWGHRESGNKDGNLDDWIGIYPTLGSQWLDFLYDIQFKVLVLAVLQMTKQTKLTTFSDY